MKVHPSVADNYLGLLVRAVWYDPRNRHREWVKRRKAHLDYVHQERSPEDREGIEAVICKYRVDRRARSDTMFMDEGAKEPYRAAWNMPAHSSPVLPEMYRSPSKGAGPQAAGAAPRTRF